MRLAPLLVLLWPALGLAAEPTLPMPSEVASARAELDDLARILAVRPCSAVPAARLVEVRQALDPALALLEGTGEAAPDADSRRWALRMLEVGRARARAIAEAPVPATCEASPAPPRPGPRRVRPERATLEPLPAPLSDDPLTLAFDPEPAVATGT